MRRQRQRIRRQSKPLCDICGDAVGVERHHIITDYMTMGNEEARELADCAELCALLCRDCHQNLADKPKYRDMLFREQFRLWGYQQVKEIFDSIETVMRSGLEMNLPEENDGEEEN